MTDINKAIRSLRTEFIYRNLDETEVHRDPIIQFQKWMNEVIQTDIRDPNAMTLATAWKNGEPDARIVLLRGADKNGFSFFTNYKSTKGKELGENRKACLNFFWPELGRQVRIKGNVKKLPPKISDSYFQSRPRDSRIGAWASQQSWKIEDRQKLEQKFIELEKKFGGKKIPRPPYWGGYAVMPVSIEFWQGRENRLHDRILYEKGKNGKWKISRLSP